MILLNLIQFLLIIVISLLILRIQCYTTSKNFKIKKILLKRKKKNIIIFNLFL